MWGGSCSSIIFADRGDQPAQAFHALEPYAATRCSEADQPPRNSARSAGWAMPFSDGVFFDPAEETFEMWYRSEAGTLYATSRDGVH